MRISIIVAVAENGVIGKDNQLIWKLSEDLKQFKKLTTGHCIIMGRKTFDSIGRPLPNRTNIVISRNKSLKLEGCQIAHSLEEAIDFAKEQNLGEDIFIIGGEKIYKLSEKLTDRLYLTKVNATVDGDAFFDLEPYKNWEQIESQQFFKNEKNDHDFEFCVLEKPEVII